MIEWRCEQQTDHCWRVFAGEMYCDLIIEPALMAMAEQAGKRETLMASELWPVVTMLTQEAA